MSYCYFYVSTKYLGTQLVTKDKNKPFKIVEQRRFTFRGEAFTQSLFLGRALFLFLIVDVETNIFISTNTVWIKL